MIFKSSLSVGSKLSLAAITATALVLAAAMGWVSLTLLRNARQDGERRIQESVHSASASLDGYDDAFRKAALRDFGIFAAQFTKQFELTEGAGTDGKPMAELQHGGETLNANFAIVDQFTATTGSPATVFARQGDDFLRIATSVKKQDGSRAIGTYLGKQSPAYRDMIDGKTRVDRFPLFGTTYMHVYQPIRSGGKTIGILYVGVVMTDALAQLRKTLQAQKLYSTGAIYAVELRPGADLGNLFGQASPRKLDEKDGDAAAFLKVLKETDHGTLRQPWSARTGLAAPGRMTRMAFVKNPAWNWAIVAEVPEDEITAATYQVLILLWSSVAIALVAMALILLGVTRRLIGKPIAELASQLKRLAQGDLTQPLTARSNDEVGGLIESMESFRVRLLDSLVDVRRNSQSVATASGQISSGNRHLSLRTAEQSMALEKTALSMQQLGQTVSQNAKNAQQANDLARGASDVAQEGGKVVREVVDTMRDIDQSSKKVVDIISVIDGIAFQTNILALNAAVEAARAGEQGRGFAVVASEVRSLAGRSAAAAKEIKGLINASVERVAAGSALVDRAGVTMADVVQSIHRVTAIMADISAASAEQSAGVSLVGGTVQQLDRTTQQNAVLVQQSAAAAEHLARQADGMVQAVAFFQLGDRSVAQRA